jgi:hypothetical protein
MNLFMASGLLGVLGMSDQEWERDGVSPARRPDDEREELG